MAERRITQVLGEAEYAGATNQRRVTQVLVQVEYYVPRGKTNAKFITVMLDNAEGALTDISAYVSSIGTMGLVFDTTDITVYADGAKNVVIGQPSAPLQLSGPVDITIIMQLIGYTGGGLTSGGGLSLDIRFGIRKSWVLGDPQFGITGSVSIGYLLTGLIVDIDSMTWTATFTPMGNTAPAWGTGAET